MASKTASRIGVGIHRRDAGCLPISFINHDCSPSISTTDPMSPFGAMTPVPVRNPGLEFRSDMGRVCREGLTPLRTWPVNNSPNQERPQSGGSKVGTAWATGAHRPVAFDCSDADSRDMGRSRIIWSRHARQGAHFRTSVGVFGFKSMTNIDEIRLAFVSDLVYIVGNTLAGGSHAHRSRSSQRDPGIPAAHGPDQVPHRLRPGEGGRGGALDPRALTRAGAEPHDGEQGLRVPGAGGGPGAPAGSSVGGHPTGG